ncbi:hypothetical protein ACHAXT_000261 [Thalassiosira profunda]
MAEDGSGGADRRGGGAGGENVIARTLQEVNAFVDAMDQEGSSSNAAAAAEEKMNAMGATGVLDDSEELSALSQPYHTMATRDGAGDSGGAGANAGVEREAEGDAALQDTEEFISTLTDRYGTEVTAEAEGVGSEEDNQNDQGGTCTGDNTSEKKTADDDVSEITKASEDLYNRINQTYNHSNSDGAGAHVNQQPAIGNNSISGSAISGGSSIENRPPPALQPSLNAPPFQTSKGQHSAKLQKLRRYNQFKQGASRLTPGEKSKVSAPLSSKQEQEKGVQPSEGTAQNTGKQVDEVPIPMESSSETDRDDEQRQDSGSSVAAQQQRGLSLGLKDGRNVSLLLKVRPHPNATLTGDAGTSDQVDDDGYGPVLFPLMLEQEGGGDGGQVVDGKVATSVVQQGGVIVVNPNAFDAEAGEDEGSRSGTAANQSKKRIAGRVTVETARLVAQVSQISSEDWARKYQFDDVLWPPRRNEEARDGVSDLASVAVEDIMSSRSRMAKDGHVPCNTLICAVGGTASGKTQTVFGPSVAGLVASVTGQGGGAAADGQGCLGLLGEIVGGILGNEVTAASAADSSALECSISILEIADEDVLRDVLAYSQEGCNEHGGTKALRVRHLDSRGAVVQGLYEVEIKSTDQLHLLLHKSFSSRHLRRVWSAEGGHGHFVATISVALPNGNVGKVQLVDLASSDRGAATNVVAMRRAGSFRKSISAFHGVLRGVVTQQPPPLPYRESTLTKLLQRCLEDQQGRGDSCDGVGRGHVVIVGTVCPSSNAYQQTLATTDFLARLVAKLGDTARSPFDRFLLSSNRAGQMVDAVTRVERTTGQATITSSQAALRSITSDPRQRLAKLMKPAPLRKDTAAKGKSDAQEDSHASDEAGTADDGHQPESYGNVLEELDTLMKVDDSDSVDRDSYGEGVMEALTPYKGDGSLAMNDGSSADSSEKMASSPMPRIHQSTNKSGRGGSALVRQEQWQKEEEETSQLNDLFRGLGLKEGGTKEEGVRRSLFPGSPPRQELLPKGERKGASSSEKSDPLQPGTVPERAGNPPKDSQRVGEIEALKSKSSIFVKKPKATAPLKMLFSLDTMDSEPLVSSKGDAHYFVESPKADAGQLPPVTEVDVPRSPSYAMFESFQQEIDSLVENLTSPETLTDKDRILPTAVAPESLSRSPRLQQGRDLNANVHGSALVEGRRLDGKDSLEGELAALKAKVRSLKEERAVSEAFVGKVQSILDGKGGDLALGDVASWPQMWKTLAVEISKRQSQVSSLQSQLKSYQSQRDELTTELQQAERRAAGLSQAVERAERGAVEAMKKVDSQVHASSGLEAEIVRLQDNLESLNAQNAAASAFFGQLDALLGISYGDAPIHENERCKFRLDAVESLKSKLNDGMAMLEESLGREQVVEFKMQELESELQRLKESSSRIETKRLETEKLAEEAVAANEGLTTEVEDLRGKLFAAQNAHQSLLIPHESALHDHEKLSVEYERARSLLSERDGDIERLKRSLAATQEEKELLESQFAMIKTKTVDMMKQRIEALKSDYARRLEDVKGSYSLDRENGEASRLQQNVSSQKAENAQLRRRIEQLEGSSSLSLQNAETRLGQVVGELKQAREDALKQIRENKAMKSELANLRGLMDIAEESVNELNRLKEENKQLNGMIKSQHDHESRVSSIGVPAEIRDKRNANANEEDRFMHGRISTLMRENEQNNISMRTLQSENVALKSSIDECSKTIQLMNSEMGDLKAIATDGVSKLRMREQSLLDQRRRDTDALAEMEGKLADANNLIASLQSSGSRRYDTRVEGMIFNPDARPSTSLSGRPKTPHPGLHYGFNHGATPSSDARPSTGSSGRQKTPHSAGLQYGLNHRTPSAAPWNEREFAAELTAEKELRFKAEEICAGVLANSKAALEDRDAEIGELKSQLFQLSGRYNR